MLDDIISEDPRVTQGIGGDNMTIMIIDLRPATRRWRTETPAVAADKAATASAEDETKTSNPAAGDKMDP